MPTFPQHRRPWLAAGGGQDSSSSDSDSDDDAPIQPKPKTKKRTADLESQHKKRIADLESQQKQRIADLESQQKQRIADLESQLKEAQAACAAQARPAAQPKRRKSRKHTLSPEKRRQKQDWGVWTSTVKRALLPASASTGGKKITVVDQLRVLNRRLQELDPPYYQNGKATKHWDQKGGYLGAVKAVALKLYQDNKQDLDFKYTENPKDSEETQAEKKATVARCQAQWDAIKGESVEGGVGGGARRRRKRKRAAGGGAAAATAVSSVASSSLPRASRRVQVGDLALR